MCLGGSSCLESATSALQADVQIYNKILALIEDWSEAIELPAYRQELSDLRVSRASSVWRNLPKFVWTINLRFTSLVCMGDASSALLLRTPVARFSTLRHACHLMVQNKAVRFPARQQRDLSEYKEGGTYNAYGQAQVSCVLHSAVTSEASVIAYFHACKARCNIANSLLLTWSTHLPSFTAQGLPPGSSGALRGEYYGPGSPPASGASPNASRSSTPYAHGGNGHFAPSPLKPQAPGARHLQAPLKSCNTHGHTLVSSCRCAS